MDKNIRPSIVCPSCGKKAAYQFINTGIIKCSACGYDTTSEYREQKKLEKKQANESETTLELVEEYKKTSGKFHRLSQKVLQFAKINATTHTQKNGKVRRSLFLFDYSNRPIKFLSRSAKSKPIWLAVQSSSWWYLPRKIKEIEGDLFIVEGPWDVFALYDALDIVSICPANGAGSIRSDAVAQLQDEFFDRNIVFVFDNDKAGRSGVEKAARTILDRARPKSVSIVDLSNLTNVGGDIDDLVASNRIDELKKALQERHYVSITAIQKKWPLPAVPIPFYDRITIEKIWNCFSIVGIERDQYLTDIAYSIYSDSILARKEFFKLKNVYNEMLSYAIRLAISEVIKKYKIVRDENILMFKTNSEPWRKIEDSEIYQIACEVYGIAYGVNFETSRKKTEVEHVYHIIYNSAEKVKFDPLNFIFFKTKVFDVQKREFRGYNEKDYYSAQLDFDPADRKSEVLSDTLAVWFNNDKTKILEFKKLLWHVMSRQRHDHKFFIFLGPGGDGKGEAAKFLESLVPRSTYVPIEKLLQEKNDTFLMAVNDSDLNISDELAVSGRVSEHTLKRLTGGAKITVDRKFKSAITTKLNATYVILANNLPAVSDNTVSFYQRLRVFEFKTTLRETENEKFNFFETVLLPALPEIVFELILDSENLNKKFEKNISIEKKVRQSSPIFLYWEDFFDGEALLSTHDTIYHEGIEVVGINITEHFRKFTDFIKENKFKDMTSERFSRGSEEILFSFLSKKINGLQKDSFRVRKAKSRYICFNKIAEEKIIDDEYTKFYELKDE